MFCFLVDRMLPVCARERALGYLGVTSDNKRRCFGTTTCVSMYVDIPEELSNATMATNRFLPRKESSPLTGLQGTRLFVLFLRNR